MRAELSTCLERTFNILDHETKCGRERVEGESDQKKALIPTLLDAVNPCLIYSRHQVEHDLMNRSRSISGMGVLY